MRFGSDHQLNLVEIMNKYNYHDHRSIATTGVEKRREFAKSAFYDASEY